jgi:hypothetical protein
MGGSVAVTSVAGEGTRFAVTLPRAADDEVPAPVDGERRDTARLVAPPR